MNSISVKINLKVCIILFRLKLFLLKHTRITVLNLLAIVFCTTCSPRAIKVIYTRIKLKNHLFFSSILIQFYFQDIDQVIKEIKQKYSLDTTLKHLLELKQAWYLNNYVKFFKLYKKSNFMCKCLIEQFIERERKQALKSIIKS